MDSEQTFSKGCQLCQQGGWFCIFLTYLCNAECQFCPAPHKDDRTFSDAGNKKEIILEHIQEKGYEGISFSGGEPLLVFDRLVEWLEYFRKHLPSCYYWLYTNGLKVDARKLTILADLGLDEIRFNIAATGYDHPTIWKNMKLAVDLLPQVAVEIPSIPPDLSKLLAILPEMDAIGIKYLNLHQLILMPDDPYSAVAESGIFVLDDRIETSFDMMSKENTRKIMSFCRHKRLALIINDCDLEQKHKQMVLRRKKLI